MRKFDITLAELKKMDLVNYLESLGHSPQKVSGNDYWYLSPIRHEKTASFKINRRLNLWYDHGIGKGGTLVDFAVEYFNCTIRDLLYQVNSGRSALPPFHRPHHRTPNENPTGKEKIQILDVRPIRSTILKEYLIDRKIPFEIASHFCVEVDFMLYGKTRTALGLPNSLGGYELRSSSFKGSNAPKAVTFFEGNRKDLLVFEGLFSFLSYQVLISLKVGGQSIFRPRSQPGFLILNSLSFFEKSRSQMEVHRKVHLFLDRDEAGRMYTRKALMWSQKYQDRSVFYRQYKDLNEYLVQSNGIPKTI